MRRVLFIIEVVDGEVKCVAMTTSAATIDHLKSAGNLNEYDLSQEKLWEIQGLTGSLSDY